MDWKELGAKIAQYAPQLGATLGTVVPGVGTMVGGAVGVAIKALAGMLGIESADPTPDEISTAIGTMTPEIALQLKVADQTFALEMRKIETEELKAQLADVQSAREREVEIVKAAGKDWDKRFLTILGAIAPLAILTYIIIDGFPTLTSDITLLVGNLIGLLFAKYSTIFDYHLGTSSRK